jgi:prolyl-tRNA editing enzyme YbaK/EbsC (Cys-tRNA(Pro) deacylase)
MEPGYLLDSNVIIGYLAGRIPASGMKTVSVIVDQTPHISVISQIVHHGGMEGRRINELHE